jgi:ubiquinone/menaquinone biosynthesis C-methylase UbiE
MPERELDALTAEARETWNTIAPGWDRNADWIARESEPVQRWLIEHLDPKPGETILELGAGPGDTGFEAARRVGREGRLISTDIAPGMIEVARQRAQAFGLDNVEFRVIDAQRIDFDEGAVDGVIHRFGPMLLPDPAASVAEVRRIMRRGRYVTAVWAGPDRNPWISLVGMSLVQHRIQPPADPFSPGGIFSLADPDSLRRLLVGGGFRDVDIQPVEQTFNFASFDELWRLPTEIMGPISIIIRNLPEDQRSAVRMTVRDLVETYRAGDGYSLPAEALCARGA